ncbi:hypothetical protein KFE94_12510 [bacterium SCSIO 12643]|nr:hypothetical protein KFE94_12510 [bacterium SCSIO 12643]
MSFYNHTQNWFNGELFEGKMVLIAGILMMIISIFIWRYGTTPNAKALVIPILSVGLFFSIGIGWIMRDYPQRMAQSERAFKENPAEFMLQEKERVEGFQILYTYSLIFATFSFVLTIVGFGFLNNRIFQSICIALLLISFTLIIIDHFSKERSKIYYIEILKHLNEPSGQ